MVPHVSAPLSWAARPASLSRGGGDPSSPPPGFTQSVLEDLLKIWV